MPEPTLSERARVLLAAEFDADRYEDAGVRIRSGTTLHPADKAALRAIEAALSSREDVIEECARVCSEAIMAQAAIVGANRGSSEHGLLLRADAAVRKALKVADQMSPWGVRVGKEWGLCEHEWEEDIDGIVGAMSMGERCEVMCSKCGCPGEKSVGDDSVYWPAT